jgi:G:T/U-mismatch repair DNA glycosylase
MVFKMNQNIEPEPHAFGTFAPPGAEILIIGTFPTHNRNWAFDFFYPNKNNLFWELLGNTYNYVFQQDEGEKAVNERQAFVTRHKIALTDMLAKAIRINNSSSDNKLIPVELMQILSILEKNPSIRKIILTSRSGKISALELFKCHLLTNHVLFFESEQDKIIVGHFESFNKTYEVLVPYSPSPRVYRNREEILKEMYKTALLGKHQ